ncbi:hypothetical protein QJS66_07095 [Kocuria rhizophila]|nr:hypothetical protein QJS66_07095 [Kocuria rhizophila]
MGLDRRAGTWPTPGEVAHEHQPLPPLAGATTSACSSCRQPVRAVRRSPAGAETSGFAVARGHGQRRCRSPPGSATPPRGASGCGCSWSRPEHRREGVGSWRPGCGRPPAGVSVEALRARDRRSAGEGLRPLPWASRRHPPAAVACGRRSPARATLGQERGAGFRRQGRGGPRDQLPWSWPRRGVPSTGRSRVGAGWGT